jgi:hypothetical protein
VPNCDCCGRETPDLIQGWRFMVPEVSDAELQQIRDTQGEDEAHLYFQMSRTTEKVWECRDCEPLTTDEYHARRSERLKQQNPTARDTDGDFVQFLVYHARENEFTSETTGHEHVATVYLRATDDMMAMLEGVWALTNTINHPWWDNPSVRLITGKPERSTSVGDIIQFEDGRRWRVERDGYSQLPPGRWTAADLIKGEPASIIAADIDLGEVGL